MNHECETCKHTELNGCDYPCRWCSVVYPNTGFSDMWEKDGCDFCNSDNCECDDELHLNAEEKSVYVKIGKATAMFTVNLCPMCGKKLVKE